MSSTSSLWLAASRTCWTPRNCQLALGLQQTQLQLLVGLDPYMGGPPPSFRYAAGLHTGVPLAHHRWVVQRLQMASWQPHSPCATAELQVLMHVKVLRRLICAQLCKHASCADMSALRQMHKPDGEDAQA